VKDEGIKRLRESTIVEINGEEEAKDLVVQLLICMTARVRP
jgi:hypothetical protein